MIRATREWFCSWPMMLSTLRPDPVFEAIRKHQLAVARHEAAVSARDEVRAHVLSRGSRSEECGLHILDAWCSRLEREALLSLQYICATVPTTVSGTLHSRKYVSQQLSKVKRSTARAAPSLPLLHTWEVLARYAGKEQ
jgi:hypothetical protein